MKVTMPQNCVTCAHKGVCKYKTRMEISKKEVEVKTKDIGTDYMQIKIICDWYK